MPTVLKADILKLVDSHDKELKSFEFVDPENPLVLISPELGKTYVCTVILLNDSEYRIHHVRFHHAYSDISILPNYIDSLKPKKSVLIKIIWRPFSEKGISEKCKDGKIIVNFSPSCTVEIEQSIQEV